MAPINCIEIIFMSLFLYGRYVFISGMGSMPNLSAMSVMPILTPIPTCPVMAPLVPVPTLMSGPLPQMPNSISVPALPNGNATLLTPTPGTVFYTDEC